MDVQVSKYHGCGNDFILIREEEAERIDDLHDFIVQVCDRRFGIGADGLMVARTHPFFMEYYNQDGSRAPMCGNGIRCLTCFLRDQDLLEQADSVTIETLAGTKTVEIISQKPFLARVAMGKPIDDPEAIGVHVSDPDARIYNWPLSIGDQTVSIDSFFMSTVHTLVFDENAMGDIEAKGRAICEHPLFSEKTNVNFIHVLSPDQIEIQTFERGCGVTLACGTGACASVIDAHRKGLCGRSVDVKLRRGVLHIDIDEEESAWMTGPAVCVLEGTFHWMPSAKSPIE